MAKYIAPIRGTEAVKKALISIGQEIIDRAEELSKDLCNVKAINIKGSITTDELVSLNIEKQYYIQDIIDTE